MTAPVSPVPTGGFDRRSLLRRGGLALSIGAIVSACAADFGGDTAPGRVGLADEPTVLPDGTVDDVVLVRTMQSMEHSVKTALELMTAEGMYSAALQTYVDRFIADHEAAAAAMGALAVAGGERLVVRERPANLLLQGRIVLDDQQRRQFFIGHRSLRR